MLAFLNNLAGDVITFIRVSLKVLQGNFVPRRYCFERPDTSMIAILLKILISNF